MTYTPLPEPCISCSHFYHRTPILLRLEAGPHDGHVVLTERENRLPHVEIDGNFEAAHWAVFDALFSLNLYVRERHFMKDLPRMDLDVNWTLDLRTKTYRVLLSQLCKDDSYRALVFGKQDNGLIRTDLEAAHERLQELYRVFWPEV